MRHPSLAFTLLSMFTTVERASEIEGDLIEQSHVYGTRWMRRQVPLVALSLFGRAISERRAHRTAERPDVRSDLRVCNAQ